MSHSVEFLCQTDVVNILTFPHECSLAMVEQVTRHLLIVGLRDLLHVVEGAVSHHICQLLTSQLFPQKRGDPLYC